MGVKPTTAEHMDVSEPPRTASPIISCGVKLLLQTPQPALRHCFIYSNAARHKGCVRADATAGACIIMTQNGPNAVSVSNWHHGTELPVLRRRAPREPLPQPFVTQINSFPAHS